MARLRPKSNLNQCPCWTHGLPECHSHEDGSSDEPGEPAQGERVGPELPHLEHAQQGQEWKQDHHGLQEDEPGLGKQSGVWKKQTRQFEVHKDEQLPTFEASFN